MKKQLIKEVRRFQKLAGIIAENWHTDSTNESNINEESSDSMDKFLDAIYDTLNDEMRSGNFTEKGLRNVDAYLQKYGEKLYNSGREVKDIADSLMVRFNR